MGFRDLSLIKKIVLTLLILLVLGVAGVTALYFLPEKHQPFITMNGRTKALEAQVHQAQSAKFCQDSPDKPACFKSFILKNETIQYASDINQYDKLAWTICENRRNSYCFLELTHQLISMIEFEKYWAIKNIEKNHKVHSKFRTMELVLTERYFRRQRELMVQFYKAEQDIELKKNILAFIETIDKQIISIHKFKKL